MKEVRRHKREDYWEWVKYYHICNECGAEMKAIYNPIEEPIGCPKCNGELTAGLTGFHKMVYNRKIKN